MKLRSRIALIVVVCALVAGVAWWQIGRRPAGASQSGPADVDVSDSESQTMTIGDLLELARDARRHVVANLDDYAARFVKQERSEDGTLQPQSSMLMKVHTRHRGGEPGSPMRVYLRFQEPENIAGREVLWAEDLTDGKLVVREAGLMSMMPAVWLDPEGFLAMQDQRYPISEIGLTKLIEKLIERGEAERDRSDVTVTRTEDHPFDENATSLIQIRRKKRIGTGNDFSLAEIVFDPERQLVLQYRSFGWPESAGAKAPLLESYSYHDLQTNVGLADKDFSPANPEYGFE